MLVEGQSVLGLIHLIIYINHFHHHTGGLTQMQSNQERCILINKRKEGLLYMMLTKIHSSPVKALWSTLKNGIPVISSQLEGNGPAQHTHTCILHCFPAALG